MQLGSSQFIELPDKDNTPQLYGELYAKYKITGTPYLAYRDVPGILKKYVAGNKALDFGSGTGESTMFLKSCGYNAVGLDINEKMIATSQGRDQNGFYIKLYDNKIPFLDDSFDLVFSSFVLLEISSKALIESIVREIYRVLKKGGIFITIGANDNTYKYDWLTINTNFPENKDVKSGNRVKIEFRELSFAIFDYFWNDDDYTNIFRKVGFDVLDIHNPLGTKNDGYNWRDEYKFAPHSVIISKK